VKVPIRKGAMYRYKTRVVKILRNSTGLPPGYWLAEYSDGEQTCVHEKDLSAIKPSKRHGGGI
jgi:hypothetical protein